MSIFFFVLGLGFLIVLWIMIDLKIGRRLYLKRVKKIEFPFRKSHFQLFTDGTKLFNSFFQDIENAQHHLHILFYIIRDDHISHQFLDLLCKKADEGLEIRLLLDRVGAHDITPEMKQQLADHHIQFSFSNKVRLPFIFFTFNQRNHRKISIFDGKTGYIGGFNIGEEYLGKNDRLGLWRDYHLRLEGEGVLDLQHQFLHDWTESTGHPFPVSPAYFPKGNPSGLAHRLVPTEAVFLLEEMLKLIGGAKKEIWIGSPYIIPGRKMFKALLAAQARGVKIVTLSPDRSDHPFVKEAARPYLRKLLKGGAKIHYFTGGFFHAKVLIIDDVMVDVGTANFDLRSLYMNHEMNCMIYDQAMISVVRDAFIKDMEHGKLLIMKDLCPTQLSEKIKEKIAILFSPFL